MAVRRNVMRKNYNHTLYIYKVISLCPFIVMLSKAYIRRFVRPSVHPAHCPANNFKTTGGI